MWVAAAACAATQVLLGDPAPARVSLQIPGESEPRSVPVQTASCIRDGAQALAISVCDPGPGLDLTRGLEIWVHACWGPADQGWLTLKAGAGVGRLETDGSLCISGFARDLLECNLRNLVPSGQCLELEVVLPRGRALAQRTSNAAFGVVEGLALIGTQAEVQASASPDQLQSALVRLRTLVEASDFEGRLTLVIGENGLDLARSLHLSAHQPQLKAGNWVGPLLVAAAEAGVQELLLFGYHGKLVKLAGGIFHTHHHLADGRLEVLVAQGVKQGLPGDRLRGLLAAASLEEAFRWLADQDRDQAAALWQSVAAAVEERGLAYLTRYGCSGMGVGAALFNRQRQLRWAGPCGQEMLKRCGVLLYAEGSAADSAVTRSTAHGRDVTGSE
ncbi:pseudocobalamin biosynthesis protein CbiD [Synechococcus sp. MEDNS5]|nr:pseudocobalamin biosynthesis protein CbiD [Synechococcus sp. MEDNS5]